MSLATPNQSTRASRQQDSATAWVEEIKAEREEFYYVGSVEGGDHRASDLVLVSNRRLVFMLRRRFRGAGITSVFLEAMQGLRYEPSLRSAFLAATGLAVVVAIIGWLGLVGAFPLSWQYLEGLTWSTGLAVPVLAVLGWLAGRARLLIDLQGRNQPVTLRWQGSREDAIALIARLTYYRSLPSERAG